MNTSNRFKSTFAGLLTSLSVLGFAAVLPNSAHAVIITASDTLPTQIFNPNVTDFYFSSDPSYATGNIDLGLFDFGALTVPSLAGLQITISLNGLDTSNGVDDYGNVDLTIDGVDTGIQMNGFSNSVSTSTVTGIIDPTAAAEIYSLFTTGGYNYVLPATTAAIHGGQPVTEVIDSTNSDADPRDLNDQPLYLPPGSTAIGQLVVGLKLTNATTNYDTAVNGPNEFQLIGGSAALEVSDSPIPFEPSQAIGFGLIALFIGLWYVPATKEMMKRLLVPANA